MRSRYFTLAVAAAAGTLVALSPGVALAGAAIATVVLLGTRRLPQGERLWVRAALCAAVGVRVAIVAALAVRTAWSDTGIQSLAPDAEYIVNRSDWIRGFLVGERLAGRDFLEALNTQYGDTSYYWALAFLQVVTGPTPFGLHLLSTLLHTSSALLLYRLIRVAYGTAAAAAALVPILFLPTLILWSSAPLKEPPFTLAIVAGVCSAYWVIRGDTWLVRGAAVAGLAVSLFIMNGLRPGGTGMLTAALAAAVISSAALRSWRVAIMAVAILVAAVGAVGSQAISERLTGEVRAAISRHAGNVLTAGRSYTVMPDAFYYGEAEPGLSPVRAARFLAVSAARFFSVPEPWNARSIAEVAILPQQVAWYAFCALMIPGFYFGFRRDRLLTCLLASVVVMGVVIIAPGSGNVGTLVRHRDAITPFVFALGGAGLVAFLGAIPAGAPGRPNRLDAGAVLVGVLVILGVGSSLAWRKPIVEITGFEPAEWPAGSPRSVLLEGRHLRPFLRAFFVPAGQALALRDRHDSPLSAEFLLRDASTAELEMPALAPGAYDLALYDRSEEVVRKERAFTVRAEGESGGAVSLRLGGAFHYRRDAAAPVLDVAQELESDNSGGAARIVSLGAAEPLWLTVDAGAQRFGVRSADWLSRDAVLAVECYHSAGRCEFAGTVPTPGGSLEFFAHDRPLTFRIAALASGPDRPLFMVKVLFTGYRPVLQQVQPGDADAGIRPGDAARVSAVGALIGVDEGTAGLEALLVMTLSEQTDQRTYRERPVRAGEAFEFSTARYRVQGTVLDVAPADGR